MCSNGMILIKALLILHIIRTFSSLILFLVWANKSLNRYSPIKKAQKKKGPQIEVLFRTDWSKVIILQLQKKVVGDRGQII